jgi:hypothetical protein
MTVINALGGLIDPNDTTERDRPVLTRRIMDDARASGMTAVNVTVGYVFGPKEPFQESVGDVAMFSRLIAENPRDLIKVTTTADIARAKAEKKVGVILGFQNAAMMGDDPKRVDIFADMGVKIIQLTYNLPNQLGDGSMGKENRGLTPVRQAGCRAAERQQGDGGPQPLRPADLPGRGAGFDTADFDQPHRLPRAYRPAAQPRPTRSCGWWLRRAASSASTSCRSWRRTGRRMRPMSWPISSTL